MDAAQIKRIVINKTKAEAETERQRANDISSEKMQIENDLTEVTNQFTEVWNTLTPTQQLAVKPLADKLIAKELVLVEDLVAEEPEVIKK